MIDGSLAFSGFSVKNLDEVKDFYGATLGLEIEDGPMGMLKLKVGGGNGVLIYPKEDHTPASYTVLNLPVINIDEVVDELTVKGVVFEQYPGMTDEKGVARGISQNRGPDIAWFKDPAGNILSVLNDGR